ncbi:aspartic peptidase domain-containing protein [Phyllosticta citrichinensis]|uniref:Aspartic peptidase domain-containing protein n=1 Tax=Phyllosticta citrichinensis TaxID=1130410 RepID=A0ABR1Y769_9PEZI
MSLQKDVSILVLLANTLFSRSSAADLTSRASRLPDPLVFTPDQNWDGIDGQWNTFTLRVGTPQQFVRVFAATSSQQTWVVQPEGCAYTTGFGSCNEDRGWTFNISASSSWVSIGNFSTAVESDLGYGSAAEYGYETAGLGGLGEGGPTLLNTTVGAMMSLTFFLGIFGLHPKSTNFTSFNDPSPSYMAMLKEQNQIPSLSYGYTAGNQYRLDKVLASLTLGGYDSSRFTPNDLTFSFAPDNERDVVVGLQAITADSSGQPTQALLPKPVTMYIDSIVPEIWLPVESCEKFEQAFGLVYDVGTDLYLVNETLHQELLSMDPNITFTLGRTTSGGRTIDIVLPYAAFDLTAQPPYRGLANSSLYFPLRRGSNSTQYVFGRTFLQEAYLTVDHERQKFSVSQCVFPESSQQKIVAIKPLQANTSDSSGGGQGLANGAVAGIAVGSVSFIMVVLASGGLFWRYRHLQAKVGRRISSAAGASHAGPEGIEDKGMSKAELDGSSTKHAKGPMTFKAMDPEEVDGSQTQIYEMQGDVPGEAEADGRQLSEKEGMLYRERKYNGTDLDVSPVTPTAPPEYSRRAPVNGCDVRRVPLRDVGTGTHGVSPITPVSDNSSGHWTRRRFSFEDEGA